MKKLIDYKLFVLPYIVYRRYNISNYNISLIISNKWTFLSVTIALVALVFNNV